MPSLHLPVTPGGTEGLIDVVAPTEVGIGVGVGVGVGVETVAEEVIGVGLTKEDEVATGEAVAMGVGVSTGTYKPSM